MQTERIIRWQEIDWKTAESYVNRLQVRIVKAVQGVIYWQTSGGYPIDHEDENP